MVEVAAISLWWAVWWRLRGGALTAITGFDPGTGGMRAIAAIAMGLPLGILHGPWWFLLIPLLWAAWSTAGWGAFQGMGHETSIEVSNPVARGLKIVGLSMIEIDLVGMAVEGMWVMLVLAVPHEITSPDMLIGGAIVLSGAMFSPIYWLWQHVLPVPRLGRFAGGGSEWAEVFVGAWAGLVIALTA